MVMPTYEYRCPQGHEFEKFQKMSDTARVKCPVCGKVASRKISGGAGFVFKGSGFYITDYGKDGKGPRQDKEPAKADAGADEKSAPKAEPAGEAAKSDKGGQPEKAAKPEKAEKKSSRKKASS